MVKCIDRAIQAIGIKKTAIGITTISTSGVVISAAIGVIGLLAILASNGAISGAISSLAGLHT